MQAEAYQQMKDPRFVKPLLDIPFPQIEKTLFANVLLYIYDIVSSIENL